MTTHLFMCLPYYVYSACPFLHELRNSDTFSFTRCVRTYYSDPTYLLEMFPVHPPSTSPSLSSGPGGDRISYRNVLNLLPPRRLTWLISFSTETHRRRSDRDLNSSSSTERRFISFSGEGHLPLQSTARYLIPNHFPRTPAHTTDNGH